MVVVPLAMAEAGGLNGRAMLRARLAMAHLLDPQPRTPQRWPPQARRYVAVALAALDALDALPRDTGGARSNA